MPQNSFLDHEPHKPSSGQLGDSNISDKQEKRVARRTGGRRQPGSGSQEHSKGDVKTDPILIECVLPETPVLIGPGEMIQASDLSPGDYVIGGDGRRHKIARVFTRAFSGSVATIKTAYDARAIRMTPEHPVWITCSKCERASWVGAGSVKVGDMVSRPIVTVEQLSGRIQLEAAKWARKKVIMSVPMSEDLGRFLGYYAAEGFVYSGCKAALVFGKDELTTFVDDVRELYERFFGDQVKIRLTAWNSVEVAIFSSVVARWLSATCGPNSGSKKVPEFVMRGEAPLWRGFLIGLFRGDGHNGKGLVHLHTKSWKMADQARELLFRLGMPTSISKASKGHAQLRAHGETANNLATMIWGSNSGAATRKKTKCLIVDGMVYSYVDSVGVEEYTGDVINFEVEDDERYVCLNTMVHNCKTTNKKSIRVEKNWLVKISREASAQQRDPVLVASFPEMPSDVDRDWGIMPMRLLTALIAKAKEYDNYLLEK